MKGDICQNKLYWKQKIYGKKQEKYVRKKIRSYKAYKYIHIALGWYES